MAGAPFLIVQVHLSSTQLTSNGASVAHSDNPYGEYTLAKCVQLFGQELKDACTQDYFE